MILDSTTKSLELVLGSAVTTTAMPVTVDYVDMTTTTTLAGSSDSQSNGVTLVTILAAPAASTQRKVNSINVYNADSAAKIVTVRLNNNTVLRPLVVVTLQVGDTLIYTDVGGWFVLSATGLIKNGQSIAADIANTPAGNIASTTVQAAIDELDTEKAKLAGDITQDFAAKTLGIGETINSTDIISAANATGRVLRLTTTGQLIATPNAMTAANPSAFTFGPTAKAAQTGGTLSLFSYINTDAAYVGTSLTMYYASQGTLSGAQPTTQTGYYVHSTLTGAVNNYGFQGAIAAGANRWNCYMSGTALNYFAGGVLIGSSTDDGVSKLQVTGDAALTGNLLSTGMSYHTSKTVTTTNSLTTATISTRYRYFTGTAGASFAITLPAAAASIDGEVITIMSTAARATTTWISTGATFVGAPASLVANTPVKLQYHHATTQWFITA